MKNIIVPFDFSNESNAALRVASTLASQMKAKITLLNVYEAPEETTKKVFAELGLKGMARVDYMIIDEEPFIIEINTTPGLSPQSFIPQQVEAEGLTLSEFFTVIIKEALV